MGLRILSNVASLKAQHSLRKTSEKQEHEFSKLASGKRITKASDDAAGMAIANKLRAENKGLEVAKRNAGDGVSMVQVAEGSLTEASSILTRLRELSIQAASDTIGDEERGYLDMEFQSLLQEVDRIAEVSEFNGHKLINGEGREYEVQVGVDSNENNRITFDMSNKDATTSGLGVDGLSITDKSDARDSLSDIDQALSSVSGYRASLGAMQRRLQSTINNLEVQHLNQESTRAQIEDADIAEVTANVTKDSILKQAGVAVLSQANALPKSAVGLL